jgi:glucose-1-phosphate thymidylyltransferase
MRGIILAGGLGTRLNPLTKIVNKHLLPVYNKPMIYYPIETLIKAGITEIAIVVSGKSPGQFIEILKNGEEFGLKNIVYLYQDKPDGGVLDAISLAEKFANNDNVCIILGDNCTDFNINKSVKNFTEGAHIFLKKVPDPENFGVVKFSNKKQFSKDNSGSSILEIIEKPITPPSDCAVCGIYICDSKIFEYSKLCKPSARNQLEIVDALNYYIQNKNLKFSYLNGYWHDAGTPDNLFESSEYWYNKEKFDKLTKTFKGAKSYTDEAIDFFLVWKKLSILRKESYKGSDIPILWECSIDGFQWKAEPNSIMRRIDLKTSCKKCFIRCRTIANNNYIDKVIYNNIERLEDAPLITQKINFKCLKCLNVWKTAPINITSSHSGCPKCKYKNQAAVEDFLKENKNWKVETQKKLLTKPDFLKRNPSVDFFVKNIESEKEYLIEYNGQQHYYPVKFGNISCEEAVIKLEKQKKRDEWVKNYAIENGFEFIELSYSLTFEEIKNKLKNIIQ